MTFSTEGSGAKELLWADVGERLNLSVKEMRSIRTAFADLLGFGMSKTVSEELLPAIQFVANRRKEGADDDQIRQELRSFKDNRGWPEEVLSRMKEAESEAAATKVPAAAPALDREGTEEPPEQAVTRSNESPETASPRPKLYLVGGKPAGHPLARAREQEEPDADSEEDPSYAVREIAADLRRDLYSLLAAQREDILRLEQCVRKLALEVRDMRYALILGFTRKDRKKGHKGISNLLLG